MGFNPAEVLSSTIGMSPMNIWWIRICPNMVDAPNVWPEDVINNRTLGEEHDEPGDFGLPYCKMHGTFADFPLGINTSTNALRATSIFADAGGTGITWRMRGIPTAWATRPAAWGCGHDLYHVISYFMKQRWFLLWFNGIFHGIHMHMYVYMCIYIWLR